MSRRASKERHPDGALWPSGARTPLPRPAPAPSDETARDDTVVLGFGFSLGLLGHGDRTTGGLDGLDGGFGGRVDGQLQGGLDLALAQQLHAVEFTTDDAGGDQVGGS